MVLLIYKKLIGDRIMKKITMTDIAKHAKVSQATVSRVINNHPNVNDEVRKRVNDTIKDLNYLPNKAAQTLKNKNTHIIGVSMADIQNPYFSDLIAEIEKEARENGYSIILHNTAYNPLTEIEIFNIFQSRQVDGIIYVPTSNYSLSKVQSLNIPVVSVTLPVQGIDSVYLNHAQGGSLAANHFIKQGHTKFCILAQDYKNCPKSRGFVQEVYEQGMNTENITIIDVETSLVTRYQIRERIIEFFNTHSKLDFTALFCSNDAEAQDFIQISNERGIRVPEDLAVIGFDDTYIAKSNKITSIHQPLPEMARTCLKIIFDKIATSEPHEPLDIQLTPNLIIRNSTNPPK